MQQLEPDELLHMALFASQQGRADDTLEPLLALLEKNPSSVEAHYLIAANYAELGLLDRAVTHFQRTVELNPKLDIATIQYGLLLTALDRTDEANTVLDLIVDDETQRPLLDFALGLRALIADDKPLASEHINKGIAANQENAALNDDFGKILDVMNEETSGESSSTHQYLLSTYNQKH